MKSKTNRRDFVKAGLGAYTLVNASSLPLLFSKQTSIAHANGSSNQPHFFLHINVSGGWSPHYMFDCRPRSFTEANLVENYFPEGQEHSLWSDKRGLTSLVSPSMAPLKDMFSNEDFSVVNGVVTSKNFDGHDVCERIVFSGSVEGGDYFAAQIGSTQKRPLDFVNSGSVSLSPYANAQSTFPVSSSLVSAIISSSEPTNGTANSSTDITRLIDKLRVGSMRRMQERLGTGIAHESVARFEKAYLAKDEVRERILTFGLPDNKLPEYSKSLFLIAESFKSGLSNVANLALELESPTALLDTHDRLTASEQPAYYQEVAEKIKEAIQFLKDTPLGESQEASLFDRTTVLVTSEFGRTYRQSVDVNKGGSDHNTFSNCALLAGRGVQGGLFVGASDLSELNDTGSFENVSKAHLSIDKDLKKALGKVYDFENSKIIHDSMPEQFDIKAHLSIDNIVNTVGSIFETKETRTYPDDTIAPIISELLKMGTSK